MTTDQPTDSTASARSTPGLALARARRPGANDRQQPTRRQQMINAAEYAALKLEEAADHDVDPAELRLAAAGLRAAALRLSAPKPPRQPRRLPRPGDATRLVQNLTSPELNEATARILGEANARLRGLSEP